MTVRQESVPAARWAARCRDLREAGATMFDFLTAVDHVDTGELEVIAHVVDIVARERWIVVTRVDRGLPELDSLAGLYLGADWHEREAAEMFGIMFLGHPDLRPLLTTGPVGHPLRRTTPLPVRVGTPWPGSTDPADSAVRVRGAADAAPARDGDDQAAPAPSGSARPAAPPHQRVAARARTFARPPGVPPEWSQ